MSIEVGSIVKGVVTGITKFGAFVELDGGESGLVHISEVADAYVKDVNNYLKLNEEINVKVISIGKDGKIGLSIKQLSEANKKTKFTQAPKKSFDDMMSDFLKESTEKQQDLRRSLDKKSGNIR
ncbi:S1 RNA binding domain protein [Orenia metallireducens]|jgi:S1 RNA binding domain protein|uniref:S1 RNA binding domain protein n=1 Tax=Orenia metallireducens TaxID=1413210 RepID=A0A285GZZ6_9FIRM|nr:S1 RNA-binding domain-containing protein [Orenia metallireducens]PRX21819.1 S1 RNA binding domain protein [Orenia metallireducens]SNY29210.1 S1 RNA binding domain protein [Orenia metallireducens]